MNPDVITDGKVRALWVGPGRVRLEATGEILEPGVGVAVVPAGEAEESTNWQALTPTTPDLAPDEAPPSPRARRARPADPDPEA